MKKALLLPFYCDGYDLNIAAKQVRQVADFLRTCGVETEVSDLIGDARAAAAAAETYNPYSYDFAVLMPVTWSEPRLAAMAARQFFGLPLAVWCVGEFPLNGQRTEMSSTPAAAALRGCLQEMGVPCEFFPDLPDEAMTARVRAFAAAAHAIRVLRTAKVGCFGHNFNGITAAGFDLSVLRRRFGTEVYSFDCSELLHRMETLEEDAYREMAALAGQKLRGDLGEYRDKVIRMAAALKSYVNEYDLQALDVRCHTELSQTYGLTACLPLALLGDTLPCSCEADVPVVLTQLLLTALADGKVSTYVDLRTFHEDGMDVGACGFAPCGLTGGKAEIGGEGSGYLTNASDLNTGRLTMARLLKFPGGRLALHMTGAEAQAPAGRLTEYGCAPYPMAKIVPDCPVSEFLQYVGANHYALVYEDVLPAARLFCKYTGIEAL